MISVSTSSWRTMRERSAPRAKRIEHLGLASRGLAEQQVRHVGAGDQQQHRDRNLQEHDQRPDVADDFFVQRHHVRAEARVGGRVALATAPPSPT